jgi:dimethylhistidine N-methyltransferase
MQRSATAARNQARVVARENARQASPPFVAQFARDVRDGLSRAPQKELHSKYLYDDIGSALFDVITLLPEYGVTRAEERVLQRAGAQIAAHLRGTTTVAELGSGSGRKTRWILEALARDTSVAYCPIEISPAALDCCRRELGALQGVTIDGIEADYLDGLATLQARRAERRSGERIAVLFLGSTIGNFARLAGTRFLHDIHALLAPGDALVLGADLLKPLPQLLAAYDDPLGVTASFNLNILGHVNRVLGGDFDLAKFRHVARYNDEQRAIEMHLESRCEQRVTIAAADLEVRFAVGETIWTESSHKYSVDEVVQMGETAGFARLACWTDEAWPFAETLFVAR